MSTSPAPNPPPHPRAPSNANPVWPGLLFLGCALFLFLQPLACTQISLECRAHVDCLPPSPFCIAGLCRQCTQHNNCPNDKRCDLNGLCSLENTSLPDLKPHESSPCVHGSIQTCYQGPPGTDGVGECKAGTQQCNQGTWGACQNMRPPQPELCDKKDNDCDGKIDEELSGCCQDGQTRPCGKNTGECKPGTEQCLQGQWGPCQGATPPLSERCNGKDDDCDGQIDEDFSPKNKTCEAGVGTCKKRGTYACKTDGTGLYCDATFDCANPGCQGIVCDKRGKKCIGGRCACPGGLKETNCGNGQDDDCDGLTDCADSDCRGLPCNDKDACTHTDTCRANNQCEGTRLNCASRSDTCATHTCFEGQTTCKITTHNGTPCNDGDNKTHTDTCQQGLCKGLPVTCPPNTDCVTYQAIGTQTCQPTPKNGACDDKNPCTYDDQCKNGVCQGNPVKECGTLETCAERKCVGTSSCQVLPRNVGMTCFSDKCNKGTCSGSGQCLTTPLPDGTQCGTGMACCGGKCVDHTSDGNHCGGCGIKCRDGYKCQRHTIKHDGKTVIAGLCGCDDSQRCMLNGRDWTCWQSIAEKVYRCHCHKDSDCGPKQRCADIQNYHNYCTY